MPKFTLMIREVWVRTVTLEADSLKDAMKAYGEGAELDPHETTEYSDSMDVTTWTAVDDRGNVYSGDDLAKVVKEISNEQKQQDLPRDH